jgi:putative FmdB family regulatory protein
MPIYAYRCGSCGRTADVLVRNGREPTSCDDVAELAGCCATPGPLVKLLSAPYVASSSGSGGSMDAAPPMCGHCGNAPGSCMSDN